MTPEAAVSTIERLVAREVGRGSEELASHSAGSLVRAAASIASAGSLEVVVITGFFIPTATPPACETDGPIGAAQIAAAIEAVGGKAWVVTDEPCKPVVQAAIDAAGIDASLDIAPLASAVGAGAYGRWHETAEKRYASVTHTIAVERPGPSESGVPRNMRGRDISEHTAPLERVFGIGNSMRIGIGDGGNELGMGFLPQSAVARAVPMGDLIRCTVGCDALLVGGTSNWAAAGLVAALAVLMPHRRAELSPLLAPQWSRRVLEHIVACGAVDGVLTRPAVSVDGLSWDQYAQVLDELERVVAG